MKFEKWESLGNKIKQIREILMNEISTIKLKKDKKELRQALKHLERMRVNLDYALLKQCSKYPTNMLDRVFYGPSVVPDDGWICRTCGKDGLGYPPPERCPQCQKKTFFYKEVIE